IDSAVILLPASRARPYANLAICVAWGRHSPRICVEMFTSLELTGRANSHVRSVPELACVLEQQTAAGVLSMVQAAQAAGIGLTVVSSYRDFDRQVAIWNAKFAGQRPMLDRS